MVFSSLEFLYLYLPATLLMYYIVPARYLKWRNVVLFLTGLIFYGWGEPVYVFLMLFTIFVDYLGGYYVDRFRNSGEEGRAKAVLVISIVINISILGFFKYYDFFVSNLRHIPGLENLPLLHLGLPIGISFYTFQALSYVIDVYRRDANVQKNFTSVGAYVVLFPQLIAGPIVRYFDVDEMMRSRKETVALFASGVRTFIAGLAKKVIFANMAGELWAVFRDAPESSRTVVGCWMGLICYAFQIYFDFSAYSDMAVGLGKMVGFKFLENFNYPYISQSITDFWRRWHMSLSTWFREYVYFPLGGSRKGTGRTYVKILIVWFLTGFWHGASWNYILWGMYYCVLLIIEKAFLLKALEKVPAFLRHIYTLFFVLFGWLLFVFEDLGTGMAWFGNMFGSGVPFISQETVWHLTRSLLFFAVMIIAATPLPKKLFYSRYAQSGVLRNAACAACAVFLIICTAYPVDSSFNPFLYFRF